MLMSSEARKCRPRLSNRSICKFATLLNTPGSSRRAPKLIVPLLVIDARVVQHPPKQLVSGTAEALGWQDQLHRHHGRQLQAQLGAGTVISPVPIRQ